jgi:hypothetical protein
MHRLIACLFVSYGMQKIHVLNGDSLAEKLNAVVQGNIIVCREALIDGPKLTVLDDEFWKVRASFISSSFQTTPDEYYHHVKHELLKLHQIPKDAEFFLWFEDDLFCQCNYWFCLKLIRSITTTRQLYRVSPQSEEVAPEWSGFGKLTKTDLSYSLSRSIKLTESDVALGISLWDAFAADDFQRLIELSKHRSNAFFKLEEVITSHIDRFSTTDQPGRPQRILLEIIQSGKNNFEEIFAEFMQRGGIYGFGDVQVKNMLDDLTKGKSTTTLTSR